MSLQQLQTKTCNNCQLLCDVKLWVLPSIWHRMSACKQRQNFKNLSLYGVKDSQAFLDIFASKPYTKKGISRCSNHTSEERKNILVNVESSVIIRCKMAWKNAWAKVSTCTSAEDRESRSDMDCSLDPTVQGKKHYSHLKQADLV